MLSPVPRCCRGKTIHYAAMPSQPQPPKQMKKNEKKDTTPSSGGKFTKGHKKVGGRKKGTSNKLTGDLRKMLQQQLEDHIASIGDTIRKIKDPAQKAATLAHWAQYIMPKYSNTTINADKRRDITTEEYIRELNGKYDTTDIKINIDNLKIINNN